MKGEVPPALITGCRDSPALDSGPRALVRAPLRATSSGETRRIPFRHHPEPRGLEALRHERGEALEQAVAEGGVLLAVIPDRLAVNLDQRGRAPGAGLEAPAVGGDQPGPAEHLARAELLHLERGPGDRRDLDGDGALAEQEEAARRVVVSEEDAVLRHGLPCGVFGEQMQIPRCELGEEGVALEPLLDGIVRHGNAPDGEMALTAYSHFPGPGLREVKAHADGGVTVGRLRAAVSRTAESAGAFGAASGCRAPEPGSCRYGRTGRGSAIRGHGGGAASEPGEPARRIAEYRRQGFAAGAVASSPLRRARSCGSGPVRPRWRALRHPGSGGQGPPQMPRASRRASRSSSR